MKLESDINIKDDLAGPVSIKLKNKESLNSFCSVHIPNYNPDRFEAMAIRVYSGKEKSVTVFAIDKNRQEDNNFSSEKMPVKKFKLDFNLIDKIWPFIEEYNMTLTTGNFPLEDMQVINK